MKLLNTILHNFLIYVWTMKITYRYMCGNLRVFRDVPRWYLEDWTRNNDHNLAESKDTMLNDLLRQARQERLQRIVKGTWT